MQSYALRATVTCVKRRSMSEAVTETKKDRPEGRPKSREETPKKGMRPEERNDETKLHCESCKPLRGLFSLRVNFDAVLNTTSLWAWGTTQSGALGTDSTATACTRGLISGLRSCSIALRQFGPRNPKYFYDVFEGEVEHKDEAGTVTAGAVQAVARNLLPLPVFATVSQHKPSMLVAVVRNAAGKAVDHASAELRRRTKKRTAFRFVRTPVANQPLSSSLCHPANPRFPVDVFAPYRSFDPRVEDLQTAGA